MAVEMKALVLEPEHRYYGTSVPDNSTLALLTPQQALTDAAHFISAMRERYNCSGIKGSPRCPVVTLGGSYPGWMSAMMRLRYPGVVDMAYAASAPMKFYAQEVDQYEYYKIITDVAEQAFPGCPSAVRYVLNETLLQSKSKAEIVKGLGICEPLPKYMEQGDVQLLRDEISMVVSYTFANLNMGNYPPPDTDLKRACSMLVKMHKDDAFAALRAFLQGQYLAKSTKTLKKLEGPAACYDLSSQLPAGPNATISSGDWSGVGTGMNGQSWDFETCNFLVEQIGTNFVTDMFPKRAWTMDWLRNHCSSRFGSNGIPRPHELADLWGFSTESLADAGASRIIFTNGLRDGWSAGGIQKNLSDTLVAINIEDGAHHSDLSHNPPSSADTAAVQKARAQAVEILSGWLKDLRNEGNNTRSTS
eukprot:CAMPEP_0197526400 /NCGR_PEP_ID=MMETSP1318-20131121/17701_1 /TAXON_ID=552666 /ORGANISM="Partenskyella glossopodia, Strain RCC365" /LENGTH=417 /DNA_ID=CAMNT_0043080549 /DNA_START=207 /DNA_END=1460 /DNA_ORIENTATION=-